SAKSIRQMISNTRYETETGIISPLVGIIILMVGAGGVVGQLQTSLNTIWGVELKAGQGIWGLIRQRFISFAMILGIGFLLLVSLVISAALSSLTQVLGTFLGGTALVAHGLDLVVSFTFVSVLFAMIYKFLPDVQTHWQGVGMGAG